LSDAGSTPPFPPEKNLKYIINYRTNNQITADELRVVDETGKNLGIVPREAALKLAEERGLDLIEIVPTAKPPVAKIISFDKFRYQKEKEFKKQKISQKTSELKRVQLGIKAAQNDLRIKSQKIEEFLNQGHKVEIILLLKGREKYNKDWARYKLEEFLKLINIEYRVILEPKFSSRGLILQIIKKNKRGANMLIH